MRTPQQNDLVRLKKTVAGDRYRHVTRVKAEIPGIERIRGAYGPEAASDIQAARYHPLQAGPQAEYAGSMALGLPVLAEIPYHPGRTLAGFTGAEATTGYAESFRRLRSHLPMAPSGIGWIFGLIMMLPARRVAWL